MKAFCEMNSNAELVSYLKKTRDITSPAVANAFLATDRMHFVPESLLEHAYENQPWPIGEGQTISAPDIVAAMTEALELKKGHKVLEVGSGSGYQAGVIASIVGPKGAVHSIERHGKLCRLARENARKAGVGKAFFHHGDGRQGFGANAPYDRIIVTAAAEKIPEALIGQLKVGGILVMPLGEPQMARLVAVRKKKGGLEMKGLLNVRFVPLV